MKKNLPKIQPEARLFKSHQRELPNLDCGMKKKKIFTEFSQYLVL